MMSLLLLMGFQWVALFLEHALGWYGLLVSLCFIAFGVQDEKKKWLIIAHTMIVSVFADVMFGRPLGQSLVVFGVVFIVWSFVAQLSRLRIVAFMALGMGSALFLDPQREHLLRVGVVLLLMWLVMRRIQRNTHSQEIVLK